MRTIRLQTELPTAADRVWFAMQSPTTFLYVCRGLFGIPALSGRAEPLRLGERGTAWLWAFHCIPAYRHTIEVTEVDAASGTIRTHEHGGIVTEWNHTLQVVPITDQTCRYTDTIDIEAGYATPLVAAIAAGIFRYRQRRWHRLVRCHLLSSGTAYSS
ncbi:hypothetical protein ACFWPK_33930 [Nocardia sp. NPDC058519]|uniref:hypothetical protein n=1 Tax=Nocardia sp. NPDC058519 TaxID=3346535 RepID=UPI00364A3771